MKNRDSDVLFRNSRVVTMLLLLGAMLAICWSPARLSYIAWQDRAERDFQAMKVATPTMSIGELETEAKELAASGSNLEPGDFESYFAFLARSHELARVAQVVAADSPDWHRAQTLQIRIGSNRDYVANTFLPTLHQRADFADTFRSDAFKAAQEKSLASSRLSYSAEAGPTEYAFPAQAWSWLLAFTFCLPFSIFVVASVLKQKMDQPWPTVISSFFGDWRPLVAAATGPFSFVMAHLLYLNRYDLKVDLRALSFALSSVLTVVFSGGLAGVTKVSGQATGGKKKASPTVSVTERVEIDGDGKSSTTIVGVSDVPSGTSGEFFFIKGSTFTRTYGLFVKRVADWKGKNSSASLSAVGGIMTFAPRGGDTTVYAVTGARVRLQKGRYSWFTPHAAVETPLNRPLKVTTSAIITRPTVRVTEKFSVVVEQFGRFTRNAKPKLTTYFLGNYKLTKNVTLEAGPYWTNSGTTGMRFQFSFAR